MKIDRIRRHCDRYARSDMAKYHQMLPISLSIQNFLSYGPEPQILTFSDFDLACLIGPNGVGKSSLTEALTWGLWGQARSGSDNSLIHQGATSMNVTVEFEVSGETYRVIRKRSIRGRGGVSALEFQTKVGEEYRALTAPSIRDTQALINKIIGLSYETFVNSAYLQQGHADAFTTKRPAERKALLGEILGLSTYELLEARVRSRIRLLEEKSQSVSFYKAQLTQELVELPQLEARLIEKEKAVTEITKKLEQLEVELSSWQNKEKEVALRRERVDASSQEVANLKAEIDDTEKHLKDIVINISQTEVLLTDKKTILADEAEAKKAQVALEHWNDKLEKVHEIDKQRFELDKSFQELRSQAKEKKDRLEAEIEILKKDVTDIGEQENNLTAPEKLIEEIEHAIEKKKAAEELLTKTRDLERAQHAAAESARIQGESLKDQLAKLAEAGADCPLCRQELTSEHLADIKAEIENDLAHARDKYAKAAKKALAFRADIKKHESHISSLSDDLKRLEQSQVELDAIRNRLAKEIHKKETLSQKEKEYQILLEASPEKAEQDIMDSLSVLDKKRQLLKFYSPEYEHIKQMAENAAPAIKRAGELSSAEEKLTALIEQRKTMLERIALKTKRVAELEKEKSELARALEGEAIIKKTVVDKITDVDKTRSAQREIEHIFVELKSNVQSLQSKSQTLQELEKELQSQGAEISLLEDLRSAFGRNGIPAMLIEAAIPEIEDQANMLLGRMTDNQMTLRLELTRERKTGKGSIETLDILIGDAMGTRDYELFSGGEAFRINFALRIALSTLLTRRAGTQLRLLIIDEGFGSQDTVGRETLVTVLNAIRQEFDKVLVITHIQELKDAFSYQIRIEKKSGTSVLIRE